MTLKSLLLAAAAVPLIGIGVVQAADIKSDTSGSTSPTAPTITQKAKDAVTLNKSAGDYVTKASVGDMFEIESSKLAQDKASNAAVKDFAATMVKDHTDSSQKIKDAAMKSNLQPASALDKSHQKMLDDLKKASADKFDKTYLDDQARAHREALSLHQKYAKSGDNAELKAVAAQIVPVVQSHQDHLKALQDTNRDKIAGTTSKPKSAFGSGSSSMGSSIGAAPSSPSSAPSNPAPLNTPPSSLPQTK